MIIPMNWKRKRENDGKDDEDREAQPAFKNQRATHKNPNANGAELALGTEPKKLHECDVCGEKFVLGQALGGHMTKHRNRLKEKAEISGNFLPSKEDLYCVSTIVTRNFFPMEPTRVSAKPVEKAPVLDMDGSWLDLKLGGYAGGD